MGKAGDNSVTTREKHIANKKKELEKLCKQQIRLITKAAKIVSKPCKRQSTAMRRIGQSLAIGFQIRMIEAQKQMIMAQPIPNYVPGGVVPGSIAMVGESGPETVGGFQDCPIGEMVHVPIQWQNKSNDTIANNNTDKDQQPPGPICPLPGIDKESDV